MENELYHFGIKGMKWGIRRYQNADGSLTDAGKRRYDKQQQKEKERKERISGKTASLEKMTDTERNRYSQKRIKTMGGKGHAILSETTNYLGKELKTAAKGVAGTAVSSLGTGAAVGGFSIAAGSSAVVAGSTFVSGLIAGGVFGGAAAVTVLGATAISRGAKYVSNVYSIGRQKKTKKVEDREKNQNGD